MSVVPNILLIWSALLFVVPAMTSVVYESGTGRLPGIAVLFFFVAIAIVDAVISRKRLSGLQLEIPELIRCTKGKGFVVPVTMLNRGATLPWLRYGISLPIDFRVEGDVVANLSRVDSGTARKVEYPVKPLRRGRFFIESAHAETRSKLNLWLVRRRYDPATELRVYPDLGMERRRLASLFLMRGNNGSHIVRQVGKGRDFEQLRDYQAGDDYIDIDWKATARRQRPVTRTYQIERTQEIYVVVDHSRLSAREIRIELDESTEGDWNYREDSPGGDHLVTSQLEKFLHCSLILSSVAERQGDLFGFISFADKEDNFIRARNGKGHYNTVRDALYTLEPKPVAPDFEQLMIALRQRLTRRALLSCSSI